MADPKVDDIKVVLKSSKFEANKEMVYTLTTKVDGVPKTYEVKATVINSGFDMKVLSVTDTSKEPPTTFTPEKPMIIPGLYNRDGNDLKALADKGKMTSLLLNATTPPVAKEEPKKPEPKKGDDAPKADETKVERIGGPLVANKETTYTITTKVNGSPRTYEVKATVIASGFGMKVSSVTDKSNEPPTTYTPEKSFIINDNYNRDGNDIKALANMKVMAPLLEKATKPPVKKDEPKKDAPKMDEPKKDEPKKDGAAPKPEAVKAENTSFKAENFRYVYEFDVKTPEGPVRYKAEGIVNNNTYSILSVSNMTNNPPTTYANTAAKPLMAGGVTPKDIQEAVNQNVGDLLKEVPVVKAKDAPKVDAPKPPMAGGGAGDKPPMGGGAGDKPPMGGGAPVVNAAVEAVATAPVAVKEGKATYVIKGADGKPMGAVVAQPNARGNKLVVTQYGVVDEADASKTKAPKPMVKDVEVDIKGGKVDFKDVMKAIRAKEDPLKVEFKEQAGPLALRFDVGNGEKKKTFRLEGVPERKGGKVMFRFTKMVEEEGKGDDKNEKSMGLGANEFSVESAKINAILNDPKKNAEQKKEDLTKMFADIPELQKAFVDYSAKEGKSTVASATPPKFSGADFGELVATAMGGMKRGGGPDFGTPT